MAKRTNITYNSYLAEDVEAWAETLISKWRAKLSMLGVGDNSTRNLAKTLEYDIKWELRDVNSELKERFLRRIKFSFFSYGKYLDYGVGRGTDMIERFEGLRDSDTNPRKRKQWITEPFKAHRKALVEILMEHTSKKTQAFIVESFERLEDKESDAGGADVIFRQRG